MHYIFGINNEMQQDMGKVNRHVKTCSNDLLQYVKYLKLILVVERNNGQLKIVQQLISFSLA